MSTPMILKDRFDPATVAESMCRQELLAGDPDAAVEMTAVIKEIHQFTPGEVIINEGDCGDAVFFILAGLARISIKSDTIQFRGAGTHVGEMALVRSSARTASVTANELTVAARVDGVDFRTVANKCPTIWINIARVLANRLDERKRFIRDPNPRPYVFIASSGEQKDVAKLIKARLECPDIDCEIWSEPLAFPPGDSFLDTLLLKAKKADFAIIVFGHDDKTISRGVKRISPRDNVVFEAGLFMGAIGKKRTFVVKDQKARLKMLSDLEGIAVLAYSKARRWWLRTPTIDVSECCSAMSAIINADRTR